MSNLIVIKKKPVRPIKRDGRGAVIRITNEAADVLESLLEKTESQIPVCHLASNLIEYAAKDTIIRFEEEAANENS